MFLDTLSLILIVIYIYVLFCMIQKDDYTSMVIATLTICIILCYRRRGSLRIIDGFNPGELAHIDGPVQRDDSMPKHFEDVLSGIYVIIERTNDFRGYKDIDLGTGVSVPIREFVEIISESSARVKVWERGVGYTLACGTGACAVVVAGVVKGLLF